MCRSPDADTPCRIDTPRADRQVGAPHRVRGGQEIFMHMRPPISPQHSEREVFHCRLGQGHGHRAPRITTWLPSLSCPPREMLHPASADGPVSATSPSSSSAWGSLEAAAAAPARNSTSCQTLCVVQDGGDCHANLVSMPPSLPNLVCESSSSARPDSSIAAVAMGAICADTSQLSSEKDQ